MIDSFFWALIYNTNIRSELSCKINDNCVCVCIWACERMHLKDNYCQQLFINFNPLDARRRYTGFAQTSLRRQTPVYRRHGISTPQAKLQYIVQLPPVPKPIQLKQTTSPKTDKKGFKGNYITTMYFLLCIVCCVVYCLLCITVLCCANNQMHIFSTKFNFLS